MFERFTDRARRVVVLAQEEARMLNHHYVGTEHILLGLIHEGEGVAAKALESLGIGLETVREKVTEIIGRGEQPPSGHIPFTPRSKKVLELSLREALQLGHNYIGTEHILLGMMSEGQGVGAQVLVRLGADLDGVRQQVTQVLHEHGSRTESSQPSERPSRTGETSSRSGERQRTEAGSSRVAGPREFWLTEIQDALAKIADRLTAIERHLGMTAHPAGSGDPPGAKSAEKPAAPSAEKPAAPSAEKPDDSSGEKPADSPGEKPDGGASGGGKAVGE
jgi:ATP-dependent Clp protease ATP-binding subunit ClpA